MHTLIPLWIIGAPSIAIVILSFLFGGSSAMGGTALRLPVRDSNLACDDSASRLDPMHPGALRRNV